jgi:hypothetical protein
MNTVRIGVITFCVAAGASGYWWLRGAATDDVTLAQETRAQTVPMTASDQYASRVSEPAADAPPLDRVREPAFEVDAPGLLPPTQTLHQVLDAVNADIGPEGEYIDPAALAEVLRSDPELARLLNE